MAGVCEGSIWTLGSTEVEVSKSLDRVGAQWFTKLAGPRFTRTGRLMPSRRVGLVQLGLYRFPALRDWLENETLPAVPSLGAGR